MFAQLRTFRLIALLEGVSFLLLVGLAVPLKYLAGIPVAVRVIGPVHGLLFVVYAAMAGFFFLRSQWSLVRAAVALVASLVPFGTFWFDRSVQRELAAIALQSSAQS